MLPNSIVLVIVASMFLQLASKRVEAVRVHFVHWNTSNPIFFNGQNVIDISTTAWDYEQANIICPLYSKNVPKTLTEQYVVYNVTKEEFNRCQLNTQSANKIVALCNAPYRPNFFTLTFRSFSPTPGAFEFHPGQQYYFLSTDYNQGQSRGRCSHPRMRLIFRINDQKINQNSDIINNNSDDPVGMNQDDNANADDFDPPKDLPIVKHPTSSSSSASVRFLLLSNWTSWKSSVMMCSTMLISLFW
jgi:hypothetical protein